MPEAESGSTNRRRAPTLREVAERAGVHLSTVSRVLRETEPPDGWSPTALRVREVADELGYAPNPWAASLRTRRTDTIGVVMPRLTDTVMATMFEGIEHAATEAGYSVLLTSPPDTVSAQQRSIEFLRSRQVDGLLLTSLHRDADAFLDSLRLQNTRVLLMNRHADSRVPAITGDDRRGGRLAAEHLVALGHREIGVIAGPQHATTAADRVAGFAEVLAEAGIPLPAERIRYSGFEVDGGLDAARALLDRPDRVTAVFSVNDTAAIGVLGVARDLGLRIPDDLSLVGYNDIPLVAQLPVPLTTIHSHAGLIGQTAVHRMIELIEGKPVASERVPVELIVRASTAPPSTSRPAP
ncbi:LacI family DNA-binding transcriptional regulator [Gordonia hydrophobica]|uniref:LacI family DNA-binding transcriptional regulator n=1 Tax=Gordonia hydrophobica TaxID=40516 RepID=A0ABZ2U4I0_9ACTN|nr:LacI family DNA-binding transcriptional regulator [Gordonia hydrophobica]MBM7368264.1 LacI family transcriptional regulator [Gordonia hydrophobica]